MRTLKLLTLLLQYGTQCLLQQIYWFAPLMGGVSAGATYDVIFSTRASLRRVRACLLAFHVSEEYQHDDVTAGEFDQHLHRSEFPGSMSDDVITEGGHKDAPEHLLNLNQEEDMEDVLVDDVYDMTKDESRSSLEYRKAESIV